MAKNDRWLSREQVRRLDQIAIEQLGIPGIVLMENAGKEAAEHIHNWLSQHDGRSICIVAGTGNNGGDGFVVARHLLNRNYEVFVNLLGDPQKVSGDAAVNLNILGKMGLQPTVASDPQTVEAALQQRPRDLYVDAVLGTGAVGPPREPAANAIRMINRSGKPVIALDIPSGLDCDSGNPFDGELVIRAALTLTFVAAKQGYRRSESVDYTGKVEVCSIGIDPYFLND